MRRKHTVILTIETYEGAVAATARTMTMRIGNAIPAPHAVKVTVETTDSAVGPRTIMERPLGERTE